MKKYLVLLFLLMTAPAWAQRQVEERYFMRDFNATSTNLTFCASGKRTPGPGNIQASASTTITAVVSGQGTLASVGPGDNIIVVLAGVENFLTITSKPTDDSVVVAGAPLTFTSTRFDFIKTACGTGANDGWVSTASYITSGFVFEYNAGDWATGMQMQLQCRSTISPGNPIIAYPSAADTCGRGTQVANNCQFATASVGIVNRLYIGNVWAFGQCRMGFKVVGAGTTGTVSGYVIGAIQK